MNNRDPFNDIVRELFGGDPRSDPEEIFGREEDGQGIEFIDSGKEVYLIFELPGFSEADVKVDLSGRELKISAKVKNVEGVQSYLARKLQGGVVIMREIPRSIKSKKYNWTLRNGVLEVTFRK